MAIVATPTKEMSAALPCAISPAIPSVSKLCGKHTPTVATISWRTTDSTHTKQLNWQIRPVQQHVIFGLICSLWQRQDIHKDTLAGHYTFASPFDRMLCSEQFNSPPKPTFIEYYCQNSGFVKIFMNGQHAKCLNPNFSKKSPRTLGMSDPICVLLELNEVDEGGRREERWQRWLFIFVFVSKLYLMSSSFQ